MPKRRVDWVLIGVAIAVRMAAVLVLRSHLVPHSTYEHGEIAANLLEGRGFAVHFLGADGPTSQQAPVYPLLVAATYWLGGVATPRALLILELGQAVLSGVLVGAVLSLARAIAPRRSWFAWLAGSIAAVHPTLVYAATHVQVALVAATLLAVTLAWAFRVGRTGGRRDAVILGGWFGLLVLTDPILGLSAAGVGWAVLLGSGPRRSGLLLSLAAVTAVLCVAPWIARNARVHHEFVPIKSTFGYAFWQGNCALSEGTDKVVRASVERALASNRGGLRGLNDSLWEARHEAGYLDDIALTAADYRMLSRLSEPERARVLLRRALADLRSAPARYPRLCLRRARYFLLFDETNPKTRNVVYRASQVAISVWALCGLIAAPREVRRRLGPTLLTAGLIVAFHVMTITSVRFHIPLEPLMAIWGAAAVTRWGAPGDVGTVEATEECRRATTIARPHRWLDSRSNEPVAAADVERD
jgi:hypothetical protein